jgi:predicted metal-dependent hydrolase
MIKTDFNMQKTINNMTPNEKTMLLIANLGMSNGKVSEITQKSLGTINQTKSKGQTRYKFSELDYNRIINYLNKILCDI